MYDRSREIDLRSHMSLGIQHVFNTLDERFDYVPFFNYELVQRPVYLKHGSFDSPHVTGRYLDVLRRCSAIVDIPEASDVLRRLSEQIYASLARDRSGLPWNYPAHWMPDAAVLHNCREVILGLLAMMDWLGDTRAEPAALQLCSNIVKALGEDDCFEAECFDHTGWCNLFGGTLSAPPATTGRMIQPLVQLYRRTQNDGVLDIARRFVRSNLEITFAEDGSWLPGAGPHIHSITSTIAGIADFGALTNDPRILERARLAYDVGAAPWRSSYGWVKEFRYDASIGEDLRGDAGYAGYDIPRGEANNTGDLIQAALVLGQCGYPEYYEDADRMLRNQLLALQLNDARWVKEDPDLADSDVMRMQDVARRAIGGFCFGSPNDLISYPGEPHQINADLAGGALQAIAEAWHAITTDDGKTLCVNLLFSKADHTSQLTCPPPGRDPIHVRLLAERDLNVRIPSWANADDVRYQVGEGPTQPARDSICRGYLSLEQLKPRTSIRVWLPTRHETTQELILSKTYQVSWLNDTVVDIVPVARFRPIYGPGTTT